MDTVLQMRPHQGSECGSKFPVCTRAERVAEALGSRVGSPAAAHRGLAEAPRGNAGAQKPGRLLIRNLSFALLDSVGI